MNIQQRLLKFVTHANWWLLLVGGTITISLCSIPFAKGVIIGGLIVTLNFTLLSRTLKKALTPPHLASPNVVLVKYYIRFLASAVIIYILLSKKFVDPIGLVFGLSVVVISIILATLRELKKLIFKEAI
ncbi:MAG: ATP synthase subunit I [Desulfobacteraceae bacterium]|nr:ATP synthase subunit I [Desulfobacteraceae bacterium]